MRSPVEILRRIYHDMIDRRSSIRIVSSDSDVTMDYPPIFVIGVYRSGTTMLRYLLDSHSSIGCPAESDFILPLSQVCSQPRSVESLSRMGFDQEQVVNKLREFINYMFMNYARGVGKRRWADKTPSYIDCLDFLVKAFPEAQFLMLYRHGLDQAHSMTRGGTFRRSVIDSYCRDNEDLRVGASRYWTEKVEQMLKFEASHSQSCHRILYEDLCKFPEEKSRTMFEFLNEEFEPEVLKYGEFEHTYGREDGRALAVAEVSRASSHHADWDPALQTACLDVAKDTLAKLGYASSVPTELATQSDDTNRGVAN